MPKNESLSYEDNLKSIVINSLENSKAENILTIDLTGKTSFAKYMIIVEGMANRHVESIANRLEADLKLNNVFDIQVEGKKESSWILVDIGDVIVNIFQSEVRQNYNLEQIWHSES